MEFEFPWPLSQGEWLAWSAALVTLGFGLLLLFAPALSLRILRLRPTEAHPEAVGEARATMAGFYLGLGLCCVLLGNQPFLYLALGLCWGLTAFGRIVSMMSDRGNTAYNWVSLALEIVLAALPLVFVLGIVA